MKLEDTVKQVLTKEPKLEEHCGVCDEHPENDCEQDCFGVWGGDAVLDECGVCDLSLIHI